MYLFYDTETTGLPRNYNAPLSDSKNWPRMVQIAWLVTDETGDELERYDYIIKPEGFTIPNRATRIHGISTEKAMNEGILLDSVLYEFAAAIDKVEKLIAHNFDFDAKIVGAEFIRKRIKNQLFEKPFICTMKSTTKFCEIPGPYGYKWPTLSELHQKLFGTEFEEAHNAMVDVNACARCFFQLKKMSVF